MSADASFLQTMIVGVDGSDGSGRALELAARLAQVSNARVLAVHVLTYNRELFPDLTLDTMRSWRLDLERDLRTDWIAPLASAGVDHDCELLEADSPAEGLLDVAERETADVLVVGSRGRGGLVGRALGSTS